MDEARHAITEDAVAHARAGSTVAIAAATNEAAGQLNSVIQQAHADAGHTQRASVEVVGNDHLTIRIGDQIMTRQNDREIGVANRDVWMVERVQRDRSVVVSDGRRQVTLPHDYVKTHTHLAYASTEYGVQGATVTVGHGIVTDSSNASAVYVAATRGRQSNTLHVVAESREQARELFSDALRREPGDRGVEKARESAARDLDGMTGSRTYSSDERSQASWFGIDVDREGARSTRTPEDTAARSRRDSEATLTARDAERARTRGQERTR